MIRNSRILRKFEMERVEKEKISFKEALKIFEAMWEEALMLGVGRRRWSVRDIEKEIRIAKVINGL